MKAFVKARMLKYSPRTVGIDCGRAVHAGNVTVYKAEAKR